MAKKFRLIWVYEPFEGRPDFFTKRMFGGLAVYLHDRMMMVLTETAGDRRWKETEYPFDIWNGILLPMDRCHHASLTGQFSSLKPHPVLGKWLYLPILEKDFETVAQQLAELIERDDPRLGVAPKMKKKK